MIRCKRKRSAMARQPVNTRSQRRKVYRTMWPGIAVAAIGYLVGGLQPTQLQCGHSCRDGASSPPVEDDGRDGPDARGLSDVQKAREPLRTVPSARLRRKRSSRGGPRWRTVRPSWKRSSILLQRRRARTREGGGQSRRQSARKESRPGQSPVSTVPPPGGAPEAPSRSRRGGYRDAGAVRGEASSTARSRQNIAVSSQQPIAARMGKKLGSLVERNAELATLQPVVPAYEGGSAGAAGPLPTNPKPTAFCTDVGIAAKATCNPYEASLVVASALRGRALNWQAWVSPCQAR